MTSATIIRKFNALHKKVVSKLFVKEFLDDVNNFIRVRRIDSHGPEGAKVIDIKERLTKLLPLVNGTDFRLLINPKVRITPDLTPLKNKVAAYDKKKKFKHKKRGKKLGKISSSELRKKLHTDSVNSKYDSWVKESLKKFPIEKLKSIIESAISKNKKSRSHDSISKQMELNILELKLAAINRYTIDKKSKRTTFKHKSRGKKLSGIDSIIGKTRSGKKVYANKHATEYKDFTNQDHTDAESLHVKASHKNRDKSLLYKGSSKITAENLREKHRKLSIEHQKQRLNSLSGRKPKKNKKELKAQLEKLKDFKEHAKLKTGSHKDDPMIKTVDKQIRNISKNLSGVEYKYHEVDLGDFKKDLHKMFSDTIIQIHGLPGHGKTVYVLKLAQDRASRTGDHVLYVAHEEFGRSTLDLKLKEQKIGHKNLRIRGELTDADAKWATVIILDSVNSLDLTSKGVKKLTEKFPNKNWILILQSTKDGKFRGDQTWEHLVDIAGEVRDRKLILSKNRLDPDNKDKMAKLRMESLVNEKTEAMRIREKVKYEATKDKIS